MPFALLWCDAQLAAGGVTPAFRTYGDGPSAPRTIEAGDIHIAEHSVGDYPSAQHDGTVSWDEQ